MSADSAVQAALVAALEGALGGVTNGVFVGRPVRASAPCVIVGEAIGVDWSTKTERGRELRIGVTVRDEGASATRLHGLIGAAEAAIEGMARDLDGWRVASLVFLRSRVVREAAAPWSGLIEYRVRVMAV